MLKRILIGVGVVVIGLLLFKYCDFKKEKEDEFDYNTNLIQQQILNVGKLVVTEGHFSEVITYKNSNKYFLDMISFEKKAIVIVNAKVTVAYDLHQMKYDIDEKNKTITILSIPKEEIRFIPTSNIMMWSKANSMNLLEPITTKSIKQLKPEWLKK